MAFPDETYKMEFECKNCKQNSSRVFIPKGQSVHDFLAQLKADILCSVCGLPIKKSHESHLW